MYEWGSYYAQLQAYWNELKTEGSTREDDAIKYSKELQCKIDNLLNEIECLVKEHKISNEIGMTLKDIIKTNDEELENGN